MFDCSYKCISLLKTSWTLQVLLCNEQHIRSVCVYVCLWVWGVKNAWMCIYYRPPPPLEATIVTEAEAKRWMLSGPFMGFGWQSGRVLSLSKCPHCKERGKTLQQSPCFSASTFTRLVTPPHYLTVNVFTCQTCNKPHPANQSTFSWINQIMLITRTLNVIKELGWVCRNNKLFKD